MSAETKQLSFDQYMEAPDTRFDEIETPRGIVKVGSVSSADILTWFDENDDPVKKHFAGLRLVVKSIVNPDGSRVPEEQREAAVVALSKHDSLENGRLLLIRAPRPLPSKDPSLAVRKTRRHV